MFRSEMTDVRRIIDMLSKNVMDLGDLVRENSSGNTNTGIAAASTININRQNVDKRSNERTPAYSMTEQTGYSRIRDREIRAPMSAAYMVLPSGLVAKLGLGFNGDPRVLRVNDFIYRLEQMRA